jgi:hypothetical protein
MQNRSMFPYRRHGPKRRVKHGHDRKPRGPQKGLPNSARDLLPMLQPATKALAQVLAGRTGASGQLGHARTMLAQAERLIAERAHNRLTPAEREEFIEQLARLKLTLADADAEAEVQAVEREEPRPQAAPVAQERLKEMALALSVRERPVQPPGPAGHAPREASDQADAGAAEPRSGVVPAEAAQAAAPPSRDAAPHEQEVGGRGAEPGAAARGRDRLVLPRAGADQAVQALAIGGLARRRNRAVTWAAAASAAAASEAAGRSAYAPAGPAATEVQPQTRPGEAGRGEASAGAAGGEPSDPERPERATEPHGGNGAAGEAEAEAEPRVKGARRGRKTKRQGLPEGWVIDEEGFVVPGAS